MIKQLLLLCLFVVLSISFSSEVISLTHQLDLPCQYQETVLSETPISVLHDTAGMSYENPITLKDFKSGVSEEGKCICQTSFDVINLVGKEVKVKVNYQLNLSVNDKMNITDRTRTHILRDFAMRTSYDGGELCKGACQIIESDITLEYLPTNETYGKWERVNVSICKPCNGKPCLNDGVGCQSAAECGGGYCVRNYCNNNESCYKNDCKCSENEVKCDNQQCVKKWSVPNGLKPICSWEECESRFKNNTTGNCETSPEKLVEESTQKTDKQRKQFFTVFLFFVVFGSVTYMFHQKNEKDKLTLRKELTEKEIEKLKLQNDDIKKKELELERLKSIEKRTLALKQQIEKQTEDLKAAKSKKEEIIKENEERLKEATKEYKSPILGAEVWEWRDPDQNYYPCFFNRWKKTEEEKRSRILIHRHQAKKEIFDKHPEFFASHYLNIPFDGLEVHHIDHDAKNYRHENLIILTREEHAQIVHKNIKIGVRESGIKELLRLQLEAPHIEELKPKEV